MKKSYLIVLMVLALAISAQAVERDLLVTRQVEKLTADLNLTAEQVESVRTILTEQVGSSPSGEMQTSPGQQQQGNRDPGKDVRKKITALLEKDQQTALRALDYQIVPSRRLLELNDRLDLDEEQIARVEEILAKTGDGRRAQQLGGTDGSGGDRKAMKQMDEQQDTRIEQILTDDQKVLFAKMKEDRKQRKGNNPPPRKRKG